MAPGARAAARPGARRAPPGGRAGPGQVRAGAESEALARALLADATAALEAEAPRDAEGVGLAWPGARGACWAPGPPRGDAQAAPPGDDAQAAPPGRAGAAKAPGAEAVRARSRTRGAPAARAARDGELIDLDLARRLPQAVAAAGARRLGAELLGALAVIDAPAGASAGDAPGAARAPAGAAPSAGTPGPARARAGVAPGSRAARASGTADDLSPSTSPDADAATRRWAAVVARAQALARTRAAAVERRHALWTAPRLVRTSRLVLAEGALPASLPAAVRAAVLAVPPPEGAWGRLRPPDARMGRVVDTGWLEPGLARALEEGLGELDAGLAGLLVAGEAADALRALAPGLAGRVRCAYLDPPFNTGSGAFAFADDVDRARWLTGLDERARLLARLLAADGTVYAHIDGHEKERLRLVLDRHLAWQAEVIWRIGWVSGFKARARRFVRNHDTIYVYGRGPRPLFVKQWLPYPPGYRRRAGASGAGPGLPLEDTWNCSAADRLDSVQIKSFSREKVGWGALTQKPEALLRRALEASSLPGDLVLDPFLGSGTTAATAHKLGRRWVGVERDPRVAAEVVLPRLRRVVAGDPYGISRALGWRGGGGFEALELEGFADVLASAGVPDPAEGDAEGEVAEPEGAEPDGAGARPPRPRRRTARPARDEVRRVVEGGSVRLALDGVLDFRKAWSRCADGARGSVDLPRTLSLRLGLSGRRRAWRGAALAEVGVTPGGARVAALWLGPGASAGDAQAALAAAWGDAPGAPGAGEGGRLLLFGHGPAASADAWPGWRVERVVDLLARGAGLDGAAASAAPAEAQGAEPTPGPRPGATGVARTRGGGYSRRPRGGRAP